MSAANTIRGGQDFHVAVERIDVAQVLIERTGKVLLVHTVGAAGSNIDRWGLPGGGREAGETLVQAAVREVREETGLEVDVGQLLAVGEVLSDTHDLLFVFRGHATGEARVQEGEVVVEHRWLSPEEADVLMPWYPGGVRALLDGRVGYYGHPEEPLGD
jgi:8-oxo-dGTP diphosphatase